VLTIEGDIARSSSLPSAEKDVRCGIFPRAFPCVGRGREGGERNGFLMRFFSFFFFLFSFSFFFFLFLLLNYSILTLLSNIYILFFSFCFVVYAKTVLSHTFSSSYDRKTSLPEQIEKLPPPSAARRFFQQEVYT